MPLPAEWVSILKEAGVSRMDTSDLSSSAQESSSISSGLTATGKRGYIGVFYMVCSSLKNV